MRFIEIRDRLFAPRQPEGTPIAWNARHTLRSWRMTNDQIQQLCTLVSQFEGMYSNCLARVSTINTVYISDPDTLVIPYFHEGKGGSCEDISSLLTARLHRSGLIKEVNQKNGANPILIYTARGHNAVHFREGIHVWTALVRQSDRGFSNMIVLDGSYQHISHIQTNGYKVLSAEQPVATRKESKKEFLTSDVSIYENGIRVYSANDAILGLSSDKSVSFGLGFTRYHEQYIPFIRTENGIDGAVFLINPNSHRINYDYRDRSFSLTETAANEVHCILDSASKFQFQPIKKAPIHSLEKTHTSWEPKTY